MCLVFLKLQPLKTKLLLSTEIFDPLDKDATPKNIYK